jgi:hypothetical protein
MVMPVLSKSCEIVVRMLFGRSLGASFRAICGKSELVVSVWPLDIIQGDAPQGVRRMVLAWAAQHQQELLAAWKRGRRDLNAPVLRPLPVAVARFGRL